MPTTYSQFIQPCKITCRYGTHAETTLLYKKYMLSKFLQPVLNS